MKFIVILIALSFGIFYGTSTADNSGEDRSLDREDEEEEETCDAESWLPNTSIAISVSKMKNGEWSSTFVAHNKLKNTSGSINLNMENKVVQCGQTKYLALSGYFKETDDDDFAAVDVGQSVNNGDGQEDSYKRRIESATTADLIFMNETIQENLMEARKSSDRIKTVEVRMTSVENTLTTMNGTLTIVRESHANVENTLKSIEKTVNLLNTMLKGTPRYGYTTQFDAIYKGRNVRFSIDFRTATRTKPTEGYGEYAGVVSNSFLEDDQVFQIRIEERIERWSEYGIAIGVIKEKQERIKDARRIYYNDDIKGTWAIQSYSDSQSGKSDTWKDGNIITSNGYPLPTKHLPVGTILGVSRRSDGNVHFYINGVDKGAAFRNVPKDVYAFVDVINYVTKISIMN